eukprot:COSAG02_NODE_1217_length_13824_cov_14.009180_5_plen_353_part_00
MLATHSLVQVAKVVLEKAEHEDEDETTVDHFQTMNAAEAQAFFRETIEDLAWAQVVIDLEPSIKAAMDIHNVEKCLRYQPLKGSYPWEASRDGDYPSTQGQRVGSLLVCPFCLCELVHKFPACQFVHFALYLMVHQRVKWMLDFCNAVVLSESMRKTLLEETDAMIQSHVREEVLQKVEAVFTSCRKTFLQSCPGVPSPADDEEEATDENDADLRGGVGLVSSTETAKILETGSTTCVAEALGLTVLDASAPTVYEPDDGHTPTRILEVMDVHLVQVGLSALTHITPLIKRFEQVATDAQEDWVRKFLHFTLIGWNRTVVLCTAVLPSVLLGLRLLPSWVWLTASHVDHSTQ